MGRLCVAVLVAAVACAMFAGACGDDASGVSRGRRVYSIEGGPEPGLHFANAIEALDVP